MNNLRRKKITCIYKRYIFNFDVIFIEKQTCEQKI